MTVTASPRREIVVEGWDPGYGSPLGSDDPGEVSSDKVDTTVEVTGPWSPIRSTSTQPARAAFVDGVRRVDARVWIADETRDVGQAAAGICASYAAGVVLCDRSTGSAWIEDSIVRRGLFSAVPGTMLVTRHGTYQPWTTRRDEPEQLSLGLQEAMGDLEIELANSWASEADLVVFDGPLRFKDALPNAIGYVKTHHTSYLRHNELAVVAMLDPGERTPLFATTTSWSRFSWYVRLPGRPAHPWAGVVRCEAALGGGLDHAVMLADRSASGLGRFASTPHKDARAPQNLFPIAGLERRLTHLLGDSELLLRALRSSSSGT